MRTLPAPLKVFLGFLSVYNESRSRSQWGEGWQAIQTPPQDIWQNFEPLTFEKRTESDAKGPPKPSLHHQNPKRIRNTVIGNLLPI